MSAGSTWSFDNPTEGTMSKLDDSFLKRLERDRSNPWHRVIVEAERLLDRIQDEGIAEVLEAAAPGSWSLIVEAASTLEDALAQAEDADDMEPCGLSRRDEFAKAAMQGFISAQTEPFEMWPSPERTAMYAVEYADALVAALDAETP